jgi:alpha-tubulin suppressor-like RCC1 family protein
MRSAVLTAAALGTIAIAACNNDAVTGPGFTCDVTNPVQSIVIAPAAGARIVVHTPALDSDTTRVAATATSRFGAARTDVTIGFSSSDTTVATVDATGTVHARKPGTTTIKAAACGESSTTVVTVVANVARVTVSPASDTVLTGDSIVYTGHAFSAGNVLVPGVVFTFSASPASAVTLHQTSDSTVSVTGAAAGSATITATAEGTSATATALVLARLFISGTAVVSTFDAGDDLSCGIITLGHGFCWGLNNHGQLGATADSVCFPSTQSSTSSSDTTKSAALACSLNPKALATSLDFSTVSAGDSSSCGISLSGQALCWGKGTHGEIGNGNAANRAAPTLVTAALNFSSISVGGAHACAMTTTNAAYCWGSDSLGQLGDFHTINSTTPIPVVLNQAPAVFASISAGYRHTCAVGVDGTAYCWGDNAFGQLGNGTQGGLSDVPVQVAGGLRFSSISAGGDHSCGISTSGAAFCWGSNADGQLGNGGVGGVSVTPVAVSGGLAFSRISASTGTRTTTPPDSLGISHPYKEGVGHTCALTTAGAIYCWGSDADLQLGRGPFSGGDNGVGATPALVSGGQLPSNVTFVSVSTGSRHSCGVGSDGAAYCWGSNAFGALGNTLQAAFRGLPQRVATPK